MTSTPPKPSTDASTAPRPILSFSSTAARNSAIDLSSAPLIAILDADDIIETAKQGFAFFEKQFGTPYAFGKYDQLFVPEFNAGATIRYELRDDYWGKDLPITQGTGNFDRIRIEYYGDYDAAFEAFFPDLVEFVAGERGREAREGAGANAAP